MQSVICSILTHSFSELGQNDLPHPPLYPSIVISFELPAFSSACSVDEKGVFPLVDGMNARIWEFPFTVTFAYRWLKSPFSYRT